MRKKQLLAFLMAGALTVGMTPAAAFAAVDDTAFLSAEDGTMEAAEEDIEVSVEPETPVEEPEAPVDTPEEAPTDTPEEDPEIPVEDPTEAPTEAPTETPKQEQPEVPAAGEGEGELLAEETPAPTEAPENAIMIGETVYTSLSEAIAAVPENTADTAVNIMVAGVFELNETLEIPAGKFINIAAADKDTTIERASGFTGNMFQVSGSLQLTNATVTKEDGSSVTGNLTVNGSTDDEAATEGTIVEVTEGGNFTLSADTVLKGNITNGNGGAVRNTAGTVNLLGGSIIGNQASLGGAVYSEGAVNVGGTLTVTGNLKTVEGSSEENNITLNGENAVINVTAALTEGSQIGFDVNEPTENKAYIGIVEGLTYESVIPFFTYNNANYILNADGTLTAAETTPTPSPEPEDALKVTAKDRKWVDYSSVKVICNANKDGKYAAAWAKAGDPSPAFDFSKSRNIKADQFFDHVFTDLPDEKVDLYICVMDEEGKTAATVFKADKEFYKERPKAPITVTPTPDHVPVTPKVTESVVRGLENPLEFYPNKFYDFTVIGAGTQNKKPGTGDVKWVPLYWSMSSNPAEKDKHSAWRIGTAGGLKDAKTYSLFVFFQKAVYDGNNWQMTDTIESVAYKFMSKAITVTATPTQDPYGGNYGGNGDGYYGDDGYDDDYDDPEDYSDEADGTKEAVATGDTAPVGNMLMLAVASLLAGGYVLVRRRKKEF